MEPSTIRKFLDKQESKVRWLACIDAGTPVVNNIHWTLRESPLHNEFKAARVVKGEEAVFKVVCEIKKHSWDYLLL